MKRLKWRAVFLATILETLGMVPFFGSWPLQYKMLSVGPVINALMQAVHSLIQTIFT